MIEIKNRKKKFIVLTAAVVVFAVVVGILFLKLESNNSDDESANNKSSNGNAEGNSADGWVERDGKKYYTGGDNYFLTGYNEINGDFYYFDDDGAMQTGWKNVDGSDYFFGADGKRIVYGLATDVDGNTYYCLENGGCLKGKHVIAETVYFFDENGKMLKNTFAEIDNKMCYFGKDGNMATGWFTLENGEQGYASSDGTICVQDAVIIDGVLYYFDENGKLGNGWVNWNGNTGYATEGGILATGRISLDGKMYDFGENGIMQTGWISYSDGKQSYAGDDGVLVTEDTKIGNANCKFDSAGYLVSKETAYDKKVALTFDDGPSIYTPIILDAMEATNSRCTFFVVGNRVNTYTDTVKRAYDLGCEIGSHTYEHLYLTELTVDDIKSQLEKTNSVVSEITGSRCPVLRPPGGHLDDMVCDTVDVPLILWNVDTRDWETKDSEQTIKGATEGIKDGDIILMHDLYESTANAVYDIIIELQSQGFECVTVSELAEANGGAEAGHKYFSFK